MFNLCVYSGGEEGLFSQYEKYLERAFRLFEILMQVQYSYSKLFLPQCETLWPSIHWQVGRLRCLGRTLANHTETGKELLSTLHLMFGICCKWPGN